MQRAVHADSADVEHAGGSVQVAAFHIRQQDLEFAESDVVADLAAHGGPREMNT
jgi:hypothetical protein